MRFPLPDGATPEAVAAGINPGMASWLPLQARLAEAGELTTVLILGVTGISGFLAAQNARTAPPPYGTFAERIASPDAMRFPLPDGASPEAVAAGINPGMASWLPLQARQAEAGKLTTVLVLGVTGLSGFLAAQNALLLGAALGQVGR